MSWWNNLTQPQAILIVGVLLCIVILNLGNEWLERKDKE